MEALGVVLDLALCGVPPPHRQPHPPCPLDQGGTGLWGPYVIQL